MMVRGVNTLSFCGRVDLVFKLKITKFLAIGGLYLQRLTFLLFTSDFAPSLLRRSFKKWAKNFLHIVILYKTEKNIFPHILIAKTLLGQI